MENGDSWRNRRIFTHSNISSLFHQQLCLNCSVSLPRSSLPIWIAITSTFGQGRGERGRLPNYVDPSQAWSRKGKHDRWKKRSQPANWATMAGSLFPKDRNLLPTFLSYVRWQYLGCEQWSAHVFPALHISASREWATGRFRQRMDQPRPLIRHSRTPRQLWIWGMQQSAASCTTVSEEMFGVSHYFTIDFQLKCPPQKSWILQQFLLVTYFCQKEDFQGYGIDWTGPLPDEEHDGLLQPDGEVVEVPATLTMDQRKTQVLAAEINPLQQSDS